MRVMTFNIKNSRDAGEWPTWPERRAMAASVIRSHAPDLAGLQEVFKEQLDDLDEALDKYAWFGVGRDDGKEAGEYAPILHRKDSVELLDGGNFWLSETPEAPGVLGWDAHCPRIVTWGRFREKASGRGLFLFNTHLDHAGWAARRESCFLLLARIQEIAGSAPVVVTGDFNARESDEPYRILTGAATAAAGTARPESPPAGSTASTREKRASRAALSLRDARYASELPHHGPTWTWTRFDAPQGDPGDKIDFIFVSDGVRVRQHGVLNDARDGRRPSDHLPVIAEISTGAK